MTRLVHEAHRMLTSGLEGLGGSLPDWLLDVHPWEIGPGPACFVDVYGSCGTLFLNQVVPESWKALGFLYVD